MKSIVNEQTSICIVTNEFFFQPQKLFLNKYNSYYIKLKYIQYSLIGTATIIPSRILTDLYYLY